jgi:hypothetical protein
MDNDLSVEVRPIITLCEATTAADIPAETDAHPELEIFVIFTDHSGTLAALRMADHLGEKLDARLRLLMLYEVPYALPLTRPAVNVRVLEGQLFTFVSKTPVNVAAHIYLCRDKYRTVRLILKPRSIVILGGRRRWWPTAEHRLASVLKKDGHHVIFAESR